MINHETLGGSPRSSDRAMWLSNGSPWVWGNTRIFCSSSSGAKTQFYGFCVSYNSITPDPEERSQNSGLTQTQPLKFNPKPQPKQGRPKLTKVQKLKHLENSSLNRCHKVSGASGNLSNLFSKSRNLKTFHSLEKCHFFHRKAARNIFIYIYRERERKRERDVYK